MDRRDFLKRSCSACAAISIGTLLSSSLLESCKTASISVFKASASNGTVKVPLASFANVDFKLVRVNNYGYDVGILKNGNAYTALLLMCTHAGQALTRTGSGYICPLHGSRFDDKGKVMKGPATDPLQHLEWQHSGDNILVQLDQAYFLS